VALKKKKNNLNGLSFERSANFPKRLPYFLDAQNSKCIFTTAVKARDSAEFFFFLIYFLRKTKKNLLA